MNREVSGSEMVCHVTGSMEHAGTNIADTAECAQYFAVEIRGSGTDTGKYVYGGGRMTEYTAFVKKEFCEQVRTYKLLVTGLVFLLLGMMNR